MNRRTPTSAAAVIVLLAFAASGRTTPPPGDAHAEIEAAIRNYARLVKAQDAEKLAAFYTTDGELLNPGMDTLRGPEAIRKFLLSIKDVKVQEVEMLPGAIEFGASQAMQWGTYTQRVAFPGRSQALAVAGRYVADWRRQADGRWLLRRMLTQPDPVRPRE
jgi:uncharacterized protein (TIGR02246 family)